MTYFASCVIFWIFWRVLFLVLLLPSSYDSFTRTYALGSYNFSTRTCAIGHILLPCFLMSSPCFPTSFKTYWRSPPYWSSTILCFICLRNLNQFSMTVLKWCNSYNTSNTLESWWQTLLPFTFLLNPVCFVRPPSFQTLWDIQHWRPHCHSIIFSFRPSRCIKHMILQKHSSISSNQLKLYYIFYLSLC